MQAFGVGGRVAHFEQAVTLVQHSDLRRLEQRREAAGVLAVVVEAAGCAHENGVGPRAQPLLLRGPARAPNDELHAEVAAVEGADAAQLRRYLARELARRRHDDRADRGWLLRELRVACEALDGREAETEGLAGAGAGAGEEVVAGEGWRDGRGLDRGCELVPEVLLQGSPGRAAQVRDVGEAQAGMMGLVACGRWCWLAWGRLCA